MKSQKTKEVVTNHIHNDIFNKVTCDINFTDEPVVQHSVSVVKDKFLDDCNIQMIIENKF